MNRIILRKVNIETASVELRYANGDILSINCITVENEFGYSPILCA